ncbi:hypothetical protein RE735_05550 [Bacillus aerius]|uniref:hypothetical protein n=1 Tax=Bacillus aerius TaxID=293388 RepID=UPI002814DFCA|nr:hypothetical protein [Bacillus aerius]WMT30023.1 hypothetical protein RE735_05550 [Bacillus aerius]
MKLVKVITGSALSLSLLLTAVPAFAATSDTPSSKVVSRTCYMEKFGEYSSRNAVPNVYWDDYGNKWYLKGVSSWNGVWTGKYERCIEH